MLKKSLLSLAVAASLAGVSGCNISSTSGNNDVSDLQPSNDPVALGKVYPLFDPAKAVFPLGADFLMRAAADTDGTAETGKAGQSDESPVTNAIDDLDGGISTVAPIDITLSGAIDVSTVVAGTTVHLVRLPNAADAQTMTFPTGTSAETFDALDLETIAPLYDTSVVAANAAAIATSQPVAGTDYDVTVIGFDGATDNVIRIRPLTPLDGKTKYIVVVTNGVKDNAGDGIMASGSYSYVSGTSELFTSALVPIRAAVDAWEQLAIGTLALGSKVVSESNIAITTAFTTVDPHTVLKSMAYPGYWLPGVITNSTIAAAVLTAGGFTEEQIAGLQTQGTDIATAIAVGNGALTTPSAALNNATAYEHPRPREFQVIENISTGTAQLPATALTAGGISEPVLISQAGIKLPQYTVSLSENASGQWSANTLVGAVLDSALQQTAGTTPPADANGEFNVTYRFPFAAAQRETVSPILMIEPTTAAKAATLAAAGAVDGGCVKPSAGWPTIIFQHGITVDRSTTLIAATKLAASTCSAVLALDLPHHGIAPVTSDRNNNDADNASLVFGIDNAVSAGSTPFATAVDVMVAADSDALLANLAERHEGLALNGATVAPITYGTVDDGSAFGTSGDLFIRLTVFQRTRDNLRQAVMDLLNLNATIATLDLDADGNPDLDKDNVHFVGHSLGAIVGATFAAVNNDATVLAGNANLNRVQTVTLATPGSALPKLLENSISFRPSLLPGLAALGLTPGTSSLESFLNVFQATIDSADPASFTSGLVATSTPTLVLEMVGGNAIPAVDIDPNSDSDNSDSKLSDVLINIGAYPSDWVVPNNAIGDLLADGVTSRDDTAQAPMAGTDPMVRELGITATSNSDAATGNYFLTQFMEGTHGTFSSADSGAAFLEMQFQVDAFIESNGVGLDVSNTNVLAAPAE